MPTFKPKGTLTQLYGSPHTILHSNQREHWRSCTAVNTQSYIQTKGNMDTAVQQSIRNPTFKPKGTLSQLYGSPHTILQSNQREHWHSCTVVHTQSYIQTKPNTDTGVLQSTHNPTFKPKGTLTQLHGRPHTILHSNQSEHWHSCMVVHTQSYIQTKGNTDIAVW